MERPGDERLAFGSGASMANWCAELALGALAGALDRWDRAAEHFDAALRGGVASGTAVSEAQPHLAYVCLLLARGAAADLVKAEQLLAELIAARPRSGAALASAVSGSRRSSALAASRQPMRYQFRCEGDYWTMASDGGLSRLRGLRGFAYIAELLRHPHEPIYVVELSALCVVPDHAVSADQMAEHGLRVSAQADVAPLLDRRARNDYRARWRELLAEEAAARRDNDPSRCQRIQREIEMLAAELAAVGSGGGRNGPSLKERARVNVRNCITAALRAIRAHQEKLWRHLSNSIKTGTFCCYAPDRPVEWDM